MSKKLTGLSLSFCVLAVLNNEVAEADIERIIANTKAQNDADIEELITGYRRMYWSKNPDEGEAITRRLFADGKITQPRVTGDEHPGMTNGIWFETTS